MTLETRMSGPTTPPTTVETLRHMAECLPLLDGDVVMWRDALLKAAAELEAETARLDFLIKNEARVGEGVDGFYHVWGGPLGDPEKLEPYNANCETARNTIDAARLAARDGNTIRRP
ncbi:hypothetical protein [Paraburkholderia sp. DGU8]|uniref:hypothetical protein n=1 Tax=Paraburkholderia sp. DGU8 TaxID=3161997 RepID=UPI00346691B4